MEASLAMSAPGRILLVEDELLIQLLAVDYLEDAGFSVDTAGSATEAMNKLGLVPGGVDAVIVDIGLPDRKGDALIREIRTLYPSLPAVIASGQKSDQLHVDQMSNIAFVAKPYSASDLIRALRAVGVSGKGMT
jgi:DNA-binding response OmpR family regulator